MPITEFPEPLKPMLRVQQLIAVALPSGVLIFLLVAIAVRAGDEGQVEQFGLLTIIAIAFALAGISASAIVPAIVTASSRARIARGTWTASTQSSPRLAKLLEETGQVGQLMFVHQLRLILSMAILEGVAFMATITYLIEGSPIALGIAVVLCMLLLAKFPTQNRVATWLEEQQRRLRDDEVLAGGR